MRRLAVAFVVGTIGIGGIAPIAFAIEKVPVPRVPIMDPSQLGRIDDQIHHALIERDRTARFSLADDAAAAAQKLAGLFPADPRPLLLWARALEVSAPDDSGTCPPERCAKVVALLQRALPLDTKGLETENIEVELGITYSRLESFDKALAAYDKALTLVPTDRSPLLHEDVADRTLLYTNSGETLMALYRLDEAIERYTRAIALATPGEVEWQLAYWSLGVAYDRNGDRARAQIAIARVLEHDPTMSRLGEEGVFFTPPGDRDYYEGVGHEVAGDIAEATRSFTQFLKKLPNSHYAARAREHLRDLKRRKSEEPRRISVTIKDVEQLRAVRLQTVVMQSAQQFIPPLSLCYARAVRLIPSLAGDVRLGLEVSALGWMNGGGHIILSELTDDKGPVDASNDGVRAFQRCIELASVGWRLTLAPSASMSLPSGDVPQEVEALVYTLHFARR